MDDVGKLVDELRTDPEQFRATDGYGRLLDALRAGDDPDALKQALREDSDLAGDLLWTVAELEEVEEFVSQACPHLLSPDKATAAYAMEIVLRGGKESADLRNAFDRLQDCDNAVCAHAVRTLVGQGAARLRAVLRATGSSWAAVLAAEEPSPVPQATIESLILNASRDRQVVGLVLATFALEHDGAFLDFMERSDEAWIRKYAGWLRDLAERQGSSSPS